MLKNLLPKTTDFFCLFEKHIEYVVNASGALNDLLSGKKDISDVAIYAKTQEKIADKIVHTCCEELHKTFITPIDRSDIYDLIKKMDDIIDSIYAAISKIQIYKVTSFRKESIQISNLCCHAVSAVSKILPELRDLKNTDNIKVLCITIHDLESQGDEAIKDAVGKLFEEDDTKEILKWNEIFRKLEKALDRCDDVANIVEKIIIEAK